MSDILVAIFQYLEGIAVEAWVSLTPFKEDYHLYGFQTLSSYFTLLQSLLSKKVESTQHDVDLVHKIIDSIRSVYFKYRGVYGWETELKLI